MTAIDLSPPVLATDDWALSPSRALDFKNCALLYRFRAIDRLPEPTSLDAAKGSVVHAVLEQLFELDPAARIPSAADAMIGPTWRKTLDADADLAELVDAEPGGLPALHAATRSLLDNYFSLEDPTRLCPGEREVLVEAALPSGVRLKGFIDRVDRSPSGDIRVVDYKTGRSPSEFFEGKALFQLRFYALVIWRTEGVIPKQLRLYYLSDCEVLDHFPDEADLLSLERQLEAIGVAVTAARKTGDWRHKTGPLCNWCDHHAHCPAFGGTPPPLPLR